MRRRRGVRARQPGVDEEECRLEREAGQQQQEDEVALRARMLAQPLPEAAQVPRRRMRVQDHEGRDQEDQADVRRDQVVEARETHLLVAVVPDHQQPGRQCGDLPAEQEDQRMVGAVDQHEGQRGHVQQCVVHADVTRAVEMPPQVACRIEAAQQRHRQRPGEEEGAEPVQPDAQRAHRVGPRQGAREHRAAGEHRHDRQPDEHHRKGLGGHAEQRTSAVSHRQQAGCGAEHQHPLRVQQGVHARRPGRTR